MVALQSEAQPVSNSSAAPQALQSTVLPADLEFWMNMAAFVLLQVIFILGYKFFTVLNDTLHKRASSLNGTPARYSSSHRNRRDQIIDSRFVDR